MMNRKRMWVIVPVLFFLLSAVGTCLAEGQGPRVTVNGKIQYMERFGGYCVLSDEPDGMYFITNQDPKVLEELKNSGKMLKIQGRLTMGADHLMIEKIDGKKYGAKKSAPK